MGSSLNRPCGGPTLLLAFFGLALFAAGCAPGQDGATPAEGSEALRGSEAFQSVTLDVARFTDDSELIAPADLDEWVFLGSSLGLDYSDRELPPNSPGRFHVVTMEPGAYRHFKEHGEYADGSMFNLAFYRTETEVSIGRSGFTQGDLLNYEIHLIDKPTFEDGRAFYAFGANDATARMLPAGNDCVVCHEGDGAFDGTFVQFYPAIRHLIPEEDLARALENGGSH